MAAWVYWMALAALLVVLEIFSGTFYLLVLGLGLASGGLAALAGLDPAWQALAAALVAALGTLVVRRMRASRGARLDAARDPDVNLDIGQSVLVGHWHTVDGLSTARVSYRGAMWDVQLEPGGLPQPGRFLIREVRGNRFIVGAAAPTQTS